MSERPNTSRSSPESSPLESESSATSLATGHADEDYVTEAFRIGARGYVLKERMDTELVPAIAEVLAGGRYRSAGLA